MSANANASSNTACSTSSPTKCPDSDKKPVLAVGAGVGVPLALLALGLGSWAMVERRKRKVLASGMAYNGVNGNLQPPDVGILGKRGDKAELVRPPAQPPFVYLIPLESPTLQLGSICSIV